MMLRGNDVPLDGFYVLNAYQSYSINTPKVTLSLSRQLYISGLHFYRGLVQIILMSNV